MDTGVLIDGVRVTIPGVYPLVDVSGMNPRPLMFSGIVGVTAPSDGGLPDTIYRFRNYDDAKKVVRGGRILSYIARMFNPGPDMAGAREIRFIRGNPYIASASLDLAAVGGSTFIAPLKVTARDAGAWTNSITIGVAVDATDDTLIVDRSPATVYYHKQTVTIANVADNKRWTYALRNGINMTAPAGSQFKIDHTNRVFDLITNSSTVESISMDAVDTLADLVSWINRHTGWLASCIGPSYYPATVLSDNTADLPDVSTLAIFYPAESNLLNYLINAACPAVSSAVSGAQLPGDLVALATTHLAGGLGKGSDAMTSESLTDALTLASTTQMHLIWMMSTSEALQSLLIAHAAEMSSDTVRRYRIAAMGVNFTNTSPYDGAVAGATDLDNAIEIAEARLPALDGPAFFCLNGTSWANPTTGIQEQLGGLGLAAQVVGMKSGAYPGIPLTFKKVHSAGLEFPNISDSQKTRMLDAGILTVFYDEDDSVTKILQAITTRQSLNVMNRTLHGLYICHEIARVEMKVLAQFIGAPLDLPTGELIKTTMAKECKNQIRSGTNPAGFLTEGVRADGTRVPAYEKLSVSGDSTTGLWTINAELHPVGETDYIKVNNRLTPAPIELY